jgi:pyridoxine/pyridoxamine 5'-phosphate oxidase
MNRPNLKLVVNTPNENRRSESRYEVGELLDAFLEQKRPFRVQVVVKNMSKRGVAFYVKKESDVLTREAIASVMFFIKGSDKYFICEFRVVHVDRDKQGRFLHRCELTASSQNAAALKHLSAFIDLVKTNRTPTAA